MPSDDKKTKTNAAPKADVAAKKEALTTNKTEGQSKDQSKDVSKDKATSDTDPAKAEGGEKTSDTPSGYSRGEGQKAVTQAYKDNWNAIYGKKKKKKKR